MKPWAIIVVILAGGSFGLYAVLGQSAEEKSLVYFDDMYQSVAYKAQSENPFLLNGQTSQTPVEGTIARSYMPLRYGPSIEESVRAGLELESPFVSDSTRTPDPARGAFVYQTYCQVCHGAGGAGDGTVVRRGYPPPPSLITGQSLTMKDGQLFHIITYGYKNMQGYGGLVERNDRWQVIALIRQMQRPQ